MTAVRPTDQKPVLSEETSKNIGTITIDGTEYHVILYVVDESGTPQNIEAKKTDEHAREFFQHYANDLHAKGSLVVTEDLSAPTEPLASADLETETKTDVHTLDDTIHTVGQLWTKATTLENEVVEEDEAGEAGAAVGEEEEAESPHSSPILPPFTGGEDESGRDSPSVTSPRVGAEAAATADATAAPVRSGVRLSAQLTRLPSAPPRPNLHITIPPRTPESLVGGVSTISEGYEAPSTATTARSDGDTSPHESTPREGGTTGSSAGSVRSESSRHSPLAPSADPRGEEITRLQARIRELEGEIAGLRTLVDVSPVAAAAHRVGTPSPEGLQDRVGELEAEVERLERARDAEPAAAHDYNARIRSFLERTDIAEEDLIPRASEEYDRGIAHYYERSFTQIHYPVDGRNYNSPTAPDAAHLDGRKMDGFTFMEAVRCSQFGREFLRKLQNGKGLTQNEEKLAVRLKEIQTNWIGRFEVTKEELAFVSLRYSNKQKRIAALTQLVALGAPTTT